MKLQKIIPPSYTAPKPPQGRPYLKDALNRRTESAEVTECIKHDIKVV